ncbi:MAG TPA: alpha/beta hydrolase [Solirubrobacteraceae bacterium]|nr:alpha/beta hydrolase [Solirubrobacteraceae bacterium]
MSNLTARTEAWRQAGAFTEFDGRNIFVRERPGAADAPSLLFLHGYPSSSYDWRGAFDKLDSRRLIAFDFLGFGLSEKPPDQIYSLRIQADLAEALVQRLGVLGPVTIVAHDMGSSVATELLARDLDGDLGFELASALLFNASLVREQASLLWGQKLLLSRLGPLAARLINESVFRRQFAGIFSSDHPLSPEEAADQWSLLRHGDGHRTLQRLIHYNRERVTPPYAERWHAALREWPGRLELAWADSDPICTEAVLQAVLALRPQAELTRLPGLGHYPQIEDPLSVYRVVERHATRCASRD